MVIAEATTFLSNTGMSGLPLQRLLDGFAAQPHIGAFTLFGLWAMGRNQRGSDDALRLLAPQLSHGDWLRHALGDDSVAHVFRMGQCIWKRP